MYSAKDEHIGRLAHAMCQIAEQCETVDVLEATSVVVGLALSAHPPAERERLLDGFLVDAAGYADLSTQRDTLNG